MAERRFLGGKELFATAVANKLSELKSEKVPDFSRTVIVLPGKIARQNLRKELLKLFPDGLFLPRLTTPHGLLHFENDAAQEKISADAEVILWGKAVNRALAEKEHFPLLFREGALPNDPFEAGKCFAGLRNELIAGNVSIAEAADKLGARGSELARLEEYFLKELNACALADKLDLDRKAAEDTAAFAGVEKLILAGLPDLPEIILRKAQNIDRKFPEKVEVWINDPVTDSDKFDLWGTPVPEIWQNRSYLCRNIHTALNPVDGARKAALLAAKDNGVFSPDECAVVLADPALFKDFAKEFSKLKDDSGMNLAVADPAGVPLKALRISHLLNKAAAFFSAPDDYRAADELLRERDFLRYAAGVQGELGKYLNLLDNFKQRYYPDRFSCARELAEGEIKQLFAKLSYWEKIFNGSKTVVFLRKFLTEVYKETDGKAVFNGIPFSAECDLVNARLNELEKLPDTLADSISKNDLLTIFLENSGEERVTLPVPDGALVFEGRLEMPFLLQKKIIFCGMNEGYFPDRIKPTPFLTDSIRQSLGIRSNKETLIRSVCHLFSTMTGRKEDDLQLIVLRQDSENSILKPSGILFNGKDLSDNELISRCQQLFCDPIAIELKKEETAAKKFMLAPKLDFRRTNDGKMLLRVTDIDQYLRSPFDFFCSRVLGYEETDYEICEPDVRTSGTLIHAAFEELGCETFPSAEKLKDKLIANFKMVMLRNYGTELPVLLKLFSSGIIQRLGYAAEKVFAEQLKGYEVLATEYSFGGREENSISAYGAVFRGKIDRIEYNRSTQTLRITDIKTGKVDNVIKDHCTVTKNNVIKFTKLQLPLYALLIKKDEYFRKNIFPEIDNCKIECAYITVPNIVTDCDVKVWHSDDLNLILPDAELALKKIIEEISLLPENKLFTEPKKIVSPWLKPNAASALEGVEIIVPVKESKEAEEEKKNSKAPAKSKSRRCSAPTRPFETVQETSDDIGCTRCCDCPEKEKKMCRCYHGDCASCKSFNGFKSFNLITASAGTGKTYSLASRFIQLMEYGVPPESIMAVTFTKKAAGEIFDRIITRICDMALHPEKSENACTRFPAEKLPDLIRRLTASNSGDLQISTIDSFFMRLMQSFAPDFGIWGNISLLDENDDRYRRKILNRWLAELRSEEEQDALRELIKEADASNKGGIYESLIKLVNSISSYWKQNIQSTSDGLPPQIRYSPYRINADDVMKVDECDECIGRLRSFAKEYSDLHEVLGKRGMDTLARRLEKLADALEKNFAGAFFHRLDSDVTKLLETLNNQNPDKIWCDDDDDAPLAYSIELSEGLPALIRKAVRHIRALAAYQARRKTLAVAELIGKFEKIYSDAVRSSGKLTFADLPAIMINSDSSETLLGPEDHSLEMRLDARFDHYMLDEFQDTANVQMMVMGQLFNEIFSTGNEGERFRSFFCVGDMKQSIYQWRGGNPELFNFVAAKLKVLSKAAGYDALDSLSLSYRSSQTVLDAVNAVFSTPYSGSVKGVAEVLERMEYHTHRSAKKDLAGHTAVFEVPQLADDPDNISAKMKIILKVLDEVKPFEHGISVGILVQENKFGKKCAEKLRELTDLPISVDGKISAVDTMVFNVYRSLLTLALHPEDKSSSLFLSMLTFGEKVTESYLMKKLDWNENLSLAEAAAEELFSNQLSGFTAKFCRAFYAECGNSDKSALDILDKAAENFSGSPEEFLTRIADYSENKLSTANTIQIMTYHKSKGLEFDMVFLPQTGNPRGNHPKLTPESKLVRYSKDDYGTELLQPEWTAYTPVEAVSWLIPPFNENISEQKTVKNFEKCCNLYVAMTRAKRALYMLLSCSETSSTLAPDKLLQERLTPYGIAANDLEWQNEFNEPFENDPVRITFSRGSRQWYTNTHISAKALPEAVTMPKARVPETSTVSHASDGKDELFALPPERRFSEYSAKNTGTEVHKLFSKIEFIDDEFAEKEFASGASVEAQKIFISALAEDSPLRDALKKSSEDMEVWREKNFVLRDSEGNITAGTFDRVEIFRENGNIVSAVVIDYKSDSFNSVKDALIYADQLKKYRCSLAQLLDIAEDKISCKIYALKLKKIADIL